MKELLFAALLLFTLPASGQASRSELARSRLYVRADVEKDNAFTGLQTRTYLADTLINRDRYKKFRAEAFTDYAGPHQASIYYEAFADGVYTLLDGKQNTIHRVSYRAVATQLGILFGKPAEISMEFIDTRNSYPRDSLIPTSQTPRKYYPSSNPGMYLVIIPDLETVAVSCNGRFYTKQLFGDQYNDITTGLENHYRASTKFDLQVGDEIQLFYRRKWYDDTTKLAVYEDKQFKNIRYLGDTLVADRSALKFEVEGYNYLSGSKENPETFLVYMSDSGYYAGRQFVPFKNYSTELKLVESHGRKDYFLQGVTYDTVGDHVYPKIVQARSNDPYRYFILPFFPIPFIEFGNVQGVVTWARIKGVEKGARRERSYITDRNNIRDIISRSKNEVEVIIYFVDSAEVDLQIQEPGANKILGEVKASVKPGLHSFVVPADGLQKGEDYVVQINYTSGEHSGSFSDSVKAKY
ncbi:hypothetical protein [Flaviaesturariibacter aridisoli]|uniref:Uncharacterized protein n=1 Tax=Flaviaesturariibacter aridisoli TaxID=2545761 RepID=A0A4R4DZT5_9BACT|nr:hypothetical protein [Flaviaesturariibacter aridisoli]TCZ66926.1 hypothetical protein E0486_16395 [Flaviaesturariibacter aridisoli]